MCPHYESKAHSAEGALRPDWFIVAWFGRVERQLSRYFGQIVFPNRMTPSGRLEVDHDSEHKKPSQDSGLRTELKLEPTQQDCVRGLRDIRHGLLNHIVNLIHILVYQNITKYVHVTNYSQEATELLPYTVWINYSKTYLSNILTANLLFRVIQNGADGVPCHLLLFVHLCVLFTMSI